MSKILEEIKSLQESVSEECYQDIIEEVINEINKELADKVSEIRDNKVDNLKKVFHKYRDGRDCLKYEEAINKRFKNLNLRDKWDILKGIKRGKDGEFHSYKDYNEYKGKYESK